MFILHPFVRVHVRAVVLVSRLVSRLINVSFVSRLCLCLITLISVVSSESLATASTVYVYDLVGQARFFTPNDELEADEKCAP